MLEDKEQDADSVALDVLLPASLRDKSFKWSYKTIKNNLDFIFTMFLYYFRL
jgi:hypothetical protein